MTSHVHLIIGTKANPLQNIMRDLKQHTSEALHECIKNNPTESRREWDALDDGKGCKDNTLVACMCFLS